MPRTFEKPSFNPNLPVKARKKFIASGRHYKPGDDFPWQQLSVDQRRVRQLYDAGLLRHTEGASLPSPTQPSVASEVAEAFSAEPEVAEDLADLSMNELRDIAKEVGAPNKVSKKDQALAIMEARSS